MIKEPTSMNWPFLYCLESRMAGLSRMAVLHNK